MADDNSKDDKDQVANSLSDLSLNNKPTNAPSEPARKTKKVVADSWDDESLSSEDDSPQAPLSTITTTTSTSSGQVPSAPPPTPISPVTSNSQSWSPVPSGSSAPSAETEKRRPEKTDAVARRMIAAGLGLKAPKRTEEQREYEKSIREQEKKRREMEREAERKRKEDVEKAKAAAWDD